MDQRQINCIVMSEKYMTIGASMTELPVAQSRAHTSLSYRLEKKLILINLQHGANFAKRASIRFLNICKDYFLFQDFFDQIWKVECIFKHGYHFRIIITLLKLLLALKKKQSTTSMNCTLFVNLSLFGLKYLLNMY